MNKKEIITGLKEILSLMNQDLYSLTGELEIDMIEAGDLKLDETQRNEAIQIAINIIEWKLKIHSTVFQEYFCFLRKKTNYCYNYSTTGVI